VQNDKPQVTITQGNGSQWTIVVQDGKPQQARTTQGNEPQQVGTTQGNERAMQNKRRKNKTKCKK